MPRGNAARLGIPLIRPFGQQQQGEMRIRITKAGVGRVILMRSTWPEGEVIVVPERDGKMFVREGWGERVTDEPSEETQ